MVVGGLRAARWYSAMLRPAAPPYTVRSASSLSAHPTTAVTVGSAPVGSNLGAVAGNFQIYIFKISGNFQCVYSNFLPPPGPGTGPEEQHTKAAGAQTALQSRVVVARAVGAEYVTTGAAVMPPPLPSEGAATTDVAASACISVGAPARPFPPSTFLDKNRRGIGKSQSIWTDSKMETAGAPVSIPTPSRQRRGPHHPGAPFPFSRFLDKNRRDTGASQPRQPTQMTGNRRAHLTRGEAPKSSAIARVVGEGAGTSISSRRSARARTSAAAFTWHCAHTRLTRVPKRLMPPPLPSPWRLAPLQPAP
eukprot:COSAG01_NODE_3090_length_6601_cov_5.372347_7_plen_306_part_00